MKFVKQPQMVSIYYLDNYISSDLKIKHKDYGMIWLIILDILYVELLYGEN